MDTPAETAIVPERPIYDFVPHEAFDEPFVLYESANAWWKDKNKFLKLIEGFVSLKEMKRAIVFAGISKAQYYYFIEIHPKFSEALERLISFRHNVLLGRIATAPQWQAAKFLVEKELPKEYGHQAVIMPATPIELKPGESLATLVQRAFINAEGKITVSETTASLIEQYEREGNTP
jgi:hypothetical protein